MLIERQNPEQGFSSKALTKSDKHGQRAPKLVVFKPTNKQTST